MIDFKSKYLLLFIRVTYIACFFMLILNLNLKGYFKWSSMDRWQCPISNGTLETFFNNVEDFVVIIGLYFLFLITSLCFHAAEMPKLPVEKLQN